MSEKQKGFILYQDNSDIFDSLSQEQKGDLIDAIFTYQKTNELPENPLIKVAISSFVSQFKRDSQKWEKTCLEKTIAGKMGNLKRWHPELYKKVTSGKITLQEAERSLQPQGESQPDPTQSDTIGEIANIAVTDNVSVTVSVNDTVNDIIINTIPKKSDDKNIKYYPLAKGLIFVLESKLNKSLSNSKKSWADEIRKLIEIDLKVRPEPEKDVERAIQAISDNFGKEYFPEVESGSSLRSKFGKIESYLARNKTSKTQSNQEIYNNLGRKYDNE